MLRLSNCEGRKNPSCSILHGGYASQLWMNCSPSPFRRSSTNSFLGKCLMTQSAHFSHESITFLDYSLLGTPADPIPVGSLISLHLQFVWCIEFLIYGQASFVTFTPGQFSLSFTHTQTQTRTCSFPFVLHALLFIHSTNVY